MVLELIAASTVLSGSVFVITLSMTIELVFSGSACVVAAVSVLVAVSTDAVVTSSTSLISSTCEVEVDDFDVG